MAKAADSAPAKRRQSPPTKSSSLLLLANRMLGRLYAQLWKALRWCFVDGWKWILKRILDLGTLLGIAYLVWDSLYQTTVGLSFVYSDGSTGLENPITIQNKSNLFWIRNIRWKCSLLDVDFGNHNSIENIFVGFSGNISAIAPGAAANIACQKRGADQIINLNGAKLNSAHITMNISYDADFFGLWYYQRQTTVPFTWVGNISQPQWVQWPFVE
jgi:hypothetical protein